jgi:hypothetical protein
MGVVFFALCLVSRHSSSFPFGTFTYPLFCNFSYITFLTLENWYRKWIPFLPTEASSSDAHWVCDLTKFNGRSNSFSIGKPEYGLFQENWYRGIYLQPVLMQNFGFLSKWAGNNVTTFLHGTCLLVYELPRK